MCQSCTKFVPNAGTDTAIGIMTLSLIKENISYTEEGNIVHFILDDESRPQWSKALDRYLVGNHIDLQMKQSYAEQREIMTKDVKRKRFVDFVSAVKGIKVDLASGPSGYFSPYSAQ